MPNAPAYAADTAGPNPYAGAGTDPAYQMETGDGGYIKEPGWSPKLGPDGTPDPDRLEARARHDRRASLRNPLGWWKRVNADTDNRHAVEQVDSDGWESRQATRHYGPDPRWNPPAPDRLTSKLSPSRWSFMRPFGQEHARDFTGQHFSMADHRRNYPIMGMEPVRNARNTYRTEPAPWDTDILDVPPDPNEDRPWARVTTPVLPSVGRSWRLG